MTFVNEATKRPGRADARARPSASCALLAPFAPHLAEELWSAARARGLDRRARPGRALDARYLEEDEIELVVQVKGKLRGTRRAPTRRRARGRSSARRARRSREQLDGQDGA